MSATSTAVLVVDVQQGLCEGDGAAFDCEGLIERVNRVTDQARSVGVPVVFVQHESRSGYLEHGTPAWQLARGLHAASEDLRIRKTTPDAFLGTDLHSLLQERSVATLVVCGMHSEFCIDTTVRRALALGYDVVLVADGHTSAGNRVLTPEQVIAHHNAVLTDIASFGPRAKAVEARALRLGAAGVSTAAGG